MVSYCIWRTASQKGVLQMITLIEAIKKFAEQTHETIKVKGGKNYIQVKDRLDFVRKTFGERVTLKTTTKDIGGLAEFHCEMFLDDKLISTGNSKELRVGEKSYEKHESVAVGRCLAFAGFAGTELASADEMQNFFDNQSQPQPKPQPAQPNPKAQEIADEFINKLFDVSKYVKSMRDYEKQKEVFAKEYDIMSLQVSNPDVFKSVVENAQQIKQKTEEKINGRK
jgi:hypothetical protein